MFYLLSQGTALSTTLPARHYKMSMSEDEVLLFLFIKKTEKLAKGNKNYQTKMFTEMYSSNRVKRVSQKNGINLSFKLLQVLGRWKYKNRQSTPELTREKD